MRHRVTFLLLFALLVLVGWPVAAEAQAMVNPTKVLWDADAEDRAVTTRYELGYFVADAVAPVQTVSIALSATAPSGASWQAALPKAALGLFTVRLKACGAAAGGGEVCSDWSNATDPFRLTPKPPVTVRTVP